MVEYRKTNLTLPESVSAYFDTLDPSARGAYMTALRSGGWTLESIAQASRVTRERVRQLVADFHAHASEHPQGSQGAQAEVDAHRDAGRVPLPPVKEGRPKPVYVEPEPDALERLLELQPLARLVRSNSPNYREEAEEYTRLINDQHVRVGVPLYRLAKRLEVSHLALRARLVRYGYKEPKKGGTSRVYTPILTNNRPEGTDAPVSA
jgi:hypothetical protein